MPYSIEIYLVDNPNVKIKGIWPLPLTMPAAMITDVKTTPTYFIMNETQSPPQNWSLTLIGEYEKGYSPVHKKLRLYKVSLPTVIPFNALYMEENTAATPAQPTSSPTPITRAGKGNGNSWKNRTP